MYYRSQHGGAHRGRLMIHWCFTEERSSFHAHKQAPVPRLPSALKLHWTQPQLLPATGVMLSLSHTSRPPLSVPLLQQEVLPHCSRPSTLNSLTAHPSPSSRLSQKINTSVIEEKKKKNLTSVKQPRQRWVLQADSRQPWATDAYPPSNVNITLLLRPNSSVPQSHIWHPHVLCPLKT